MRTPSQVEIWTDGACRGNPGPGGWGAVLLYGDAIKDLSGHDPATTNNRMELMGAIMALEALKRPMRVKLYTDSAYVKNGITQWVRGWKAKGWKTADNKPVKNEDLWKRLEAAAQPHQIEWIWVKGHAGNAMNERADQLARQRTSGAAAPSPPLQRDGALATSLTSAFQALQNQRFTRRCPPLRASAR